MTDDQSTKHEDRAGSGLARHPARHRELFDAPTERTRTPADWLGEVAGNVALRKSVTLVRQTKRPTTCPRSKSSTLPNWPRRLARHEGRRRRQKTQQAAKRRPPPRSKPNAVAPRRSSDPAQSRTSIRPMTTNTWRPERLEQTKSLQATLATMSRSNAPTSNPPSRAARPPHKWRSASAAWVEMSDAETLCLLSFCQFMRCYW